MAPTQKKPEAYSIKKSRRPSTSECVENLVVTRTKLARTEAKLRKEVAQDPSKQLEYDLWRLLYEQQPAKITIGSDPSVTVPAKVPSPDVVAIFEQCWIVAECRRTTECLFLNAAVDNLKQIRAEIKKYNIEQGCAAPIAPLLAIQTHDGLDSRIIKKARAAKISLLDEREINYLLTLKARLGLGSSHFFWSMVYPSSLTSRKLTVPAIETKLGGDIAYTFSANAQDLLFRAYVSHRELHRGETFQGYQRMFKKSKLSSIGKYIKTHKRFPTPIIVKFERNAGEVFDMSSPAKKEKTTTSKTEKNAKATGARLGRLRLPTTPNSIQIIDGQHRLYGYTLVKPDPDHIINVLAYKHSKSIDPARMFVEINKEQTPVKPDLLWELYPDIYPVEHRQFYKATISRAVSSLLDKQLKGLVKHISTGAKGPITFQTICGQMALKANNLLPEKGGLVADVAGDDWEKRQKTLSSWIGTLFTVMRDHGTKYPNANREFLFRNVGMVPFLKVFSAILRYEAGHQKVGELKVSAKLEQRLKDFLECIYRHYGAKSSAELAVLRRGRIGGAGFLETEDEMRTIIQHEFEPKFPCRPDIRSDITEVSHRVAHSLRKINLRAGDSGKGWVFKDFDYVEFERKFRKDTFDDDGFGGMLDLLYQEIIEGSGGKKRDENGRLAELLGLESLVDNSAIRVLDDLRTYWAHKATQLDHKKKKRVIGHLKQLTGKSILAERAELSSQDFEKAAVTLIGRLDAEVLRVALDTQG